MVHHTLFKFSRWNGPRKHRNALVNEMCFAEKMAGSSIPPEIASFGGAKGFFQNLCYVMKGKCGEANKKWCIVTTIIKVDKTHCSRTTTQHDGTFLEPFENMTVVDHSFISSRFGTTLSVHSARARELRQEFPIHFVPTQQKVCRCFRSQNWL